MSCEKCGSKLIGPTYIKQHVEGVITKTGKDPRFAAGLTNTLAVVRGLHTATNEGKEPCKYCISTYEKIINQLMEI